MGKLRLVASCLGLLISGSSLALDWEEMSDSFTVHGFASAGYVKSTKNNYLGNTTDGMADFHEFALNARMQLTDDLSFGAQVFGRRLGPLGGSQAKLDWAYFDYNFNNYLGIRLGRVKVPFGLHNETQDYDSLRTSIFLPPGIYSQFYREAIIAVNGGLVYGNLPFFMDSSLDYQFYIGQNELEHNDGVALLFEDVGNGALWGQTTDTDVHGIYGGQINWNTPVDGLRLCASLFVMDFDVEAETPTVSGLFGTPNPTVLEYRQLQYWAYSAEYLYENWTFQAEWARLGGDIYTNISPTYLGLAGQKNPLENNIESWYALVSYRFNEWFELGTYYSIYYGDRDNKDGGGAAYEGNEYNQWQKDLCVTARFDITPRVILKLEAHRVDGTSDVSNLENPDGDFKRHWNYYAAKVTYHF